MRVIFLDVDGVLNYVYCEARAPCGCLGIEDAPLAVLRKIVDRTGAKIVLTSTWKMEWSKNPELRSADGEYLDQKIKQAGMEIYDKTQDNIYDRGMGIQTWLSRHPEVTNWIVLDDNVFNDYRCSGIMPHLIQTSFVDGGLKHEMIPRCESMLLQEENEDGD